MNEIRSKSPVSRGGVSIFCCGLKRNTSVWAKESILNLSQVDLAPFADYAAAV